MDLANDICRLGSYIFCLNFSDVLSSIRFPRGSHVFFLMFSPFFVGDFAHSFASSFISSQTTVGQF